MNAIFTKDQVIAAYNDAPNLVKGVFNDEKTTNVVVGLQQKYQLHIDQAGFIGKELGYLLLGLIDPTAFTARLKNKGFSEVVISDIANEINQQIFMPLQKQMQEESKKVTPPAPQQARPAPPQMRPPPPTPRVNVPTPSYQPPRPPVSAAPAPKQTSSLHDVVQQVAARPPTVQPKMQMPAKPDHLLPLGEEESHVAPLPPKMAMPQSGPPRTGQTPINTPATNGPPPMPIPKPRPGHPVNLLNPQPRPIVPPPAPAFSAPVPSALMAPAQPVVPPASIKPPQPSQPIPPPPARTGADPYREPIA